MKTWMLLCASLFSLSACESPPLAEELHEHQSSVVAVVKRLIAADNRRDLAAALDCYVKDAIWRPPNGDMLEGKEAIATRYRDLFERFEVSLVMEASDCEVVGDWGFVRGTTHGELKAIDGSPSIFVDDEFTAIMSHERDGAWKISCLMWGPRGASNP